ncbi:MAG: TonB family protein [Methylophilaceae bacterium]
MMSSFEKLLVGLKNLSPMAMAIWLSVSAHAIFFAIKFEPEIKDFAKRLPSLEVVLVNAKTKNAPDQADVIAQANLDRGGNTDLDRQMKTALPAPKQRAADVKLQTSKKANSATKASKLKAKEAKEEKRVAELEEKAQELLTQIKSEKKIETKPATKQTLDREALLAASLEIDRLEAQIAKQQEEYQKRPKRRFLGSRAKAADDALYLEAWRQKVERIGNLNYPAAARSQKIYGRLQLTVSIRANGSVEKVVIDKSSGSKVLDDAAINIVKLAAPYAKFSKVMRKTTDILDITRTWTFTNEDALSTQ